MASMNSEKNDTIDKCTALLKKLLHTPTLLLMGGEMTGQEIRTVHAVLNNRIAEMEKLKDK